MNMNCNSIQCWNCGIDYDHIKNCRCPDCNESETIRMTDLDLNMNFDPIGLDPVRVENYDINGLNVTVQELNTQAIINRFGIRWINLEVPEITYYATGIDPYRLNS